MSNANIYVSITYGKEVLTIDGNFRLFQELISTLKDDGLPVIGVHFPQEQPTTPHPAPVLEPVQV